MKDENIIALIKDLKKQNIDVVAQNDSLKLSGSIENISKNKIQKNKPATFNLLKDSVIKDLPNGKIVDIGDTISEIKITQIQKTAVNGLFDGREVTLKP